MATRRLPGQKKKTYHRNVPRLPQFDVAVKVANASIVVAFRAGMVMIGHQTLVAVRQSVLTSHKQVVVGQLLEADPALALHGVIDGLPVAHADLGFGMTQRLKPGFNSQQLIDEQAVGSKFFAYFGLDVQKRAFFVDDDDAVRQCFVSLHLSGKRVDALAIAAASAALERHFIGAFDALAFRRDQSRLKIRNNGHRFGLHFIPLFENHGGWLVGVAADW